MPNTNPPKNQLVNSNANTETPHNKKRGRDRNNSKKKFCNSHRLRCIEIVFAGVLVAVGIAYTVFAALQWTAMNDQRVEMQKTTRIAADNYGLQTKAFHIDQRAWVSAQSPQESKIPEADSKYATSIPIKNTGKSFAREVSIHGELGFTRSDSEPDFKSYPSDKLEVIRGLLLAPNGEYNLNLVTNQPLQPEQVALFKSGEWKYICYGFVSYYDIFDCVHWTIFCFVLRPEDGKWTYYKTHNQADNGECD
jgi:hypothetical protein